MIRSKTHSVYGANASEKGWVPAPRYLLRRDRILKIIEPLPRGYLLEVGCGAGAILKDLSQMGFSCAALETSPAAFELVSHINGDNPNVKIYQQAQSGWISAFDYLLAFEVLEHILDDQAALEQWAGWLKPRGRFLMSVPAHPKRWNASDVWAGHFRRYERAGLEDLIAQAGFNIVQMECYGFPLANLIEPIRARHHAKQLNSQSLMRNKTEQRAVHSARSGVERSLEVKLYPLQASWLGTKVMQFFCALQGIFSSTNLGNGFIVLAR